MQNRLTKTHRRPMRPVTPVTRASRGAAGAAMAATFVLTGAGAANATLDSQNDAAEPSSTTIVPVEATVVSIPVADEADAVEFGAIAVTEPASLKATAPEPEVEEEAPAVASSESQAPANDARSERAASTQDSNDDAQAKEQSQAAPAASQVVAGDSVMQTARNAIGTRYVYGGTSPSSGFDCSGFVQWVYAQHGINLPRTASAQASFATRISASEARPGDLVYYPGHIGIYAGNGRIIDAGTRQSNTSERPMWNANWSYYRVR